MSSDDEESEMSADDEYLEAVYLCLLPSEVEMNHRKDIVKRLEEMVWEKWPAGVFLVYGSYGAGIALSSSDIDSTVVVEGLESSPESLEIIGGLLADKDFENIKLKPLHTVPMVACQDKISGIFVDITINNIRPLKNAKLLKSALEFNPVVKKILILIKLWVKSQRLIKLRGCMASFGFSIIALFFLQDKKVIANLFGQDGKLLSEGELSLPKEEMASVKYSLKELLKEFFYYFTSKFSYERDVVSVRAAGLLTKSEKGWEDRKVENNGILKHFFCIEDPFDIEIDIGYRLMKLNSELMISCFEKAFDVLNGEGIENLFVTYKEIDERREKRAAWAKLKNENRKEQKRAKREESMN